MSNQKIVHPDFARRMAQACDGNPDVPPPNYGRLGWFADKIEERTGKRVANETVRKWLVGEVRPRPKMISALAAVLKVDEGWLSLGRTPELSEREMRLRNASADGVVNLVASMVRMFGANPAFPGEDDKFAQENKIDLYAIIRGAQYAIHVALFQDGKAVIPIEAKDAFVIGVEHLGGTSFRLLDLTDFEDVAKRKGGAFEVALDARDWKVIESFAERI